jgi:hypothetical protein
LQSQEASKTLSEDISNGLFGANNTKFSKDSQEKQSKKYIFKQHRFFLIDSMRYQ